MNTNTATAKARCYMEYCCDAATFEVEVLNRSGNPEIAPIPWGWCSQHQHNAWSVRSS